MADFFSIVSVIVHHLVSRVTRTASLFFEACKSSKNVMKAIEDNKEKV